MAFAQHRWRDRLGPVGFTWRLGAVKFQFISICTHAAHERRRLWQIHKQWCPITVSRALNRPRVGS